MIGISLLSKLEDSSNVSTISNTPDCKTAGTVESCGVGVSAVNRVHSKLYLSRIVGRWHLSWLKQRQFLSWFTPKQDKCWKPFYPEGGRKLPATRLCLPFLKKDMNPIWMWAIKRLLYIFYIKCQSCENLLQDIS